MPRFFSSATKQSSVSNCFGSSARVSSPPRTNRLADQFESRKWNRTQLIPNRARCAATTGASSFEGKHAEPVTLTPQMRNRRPSGVTRCPSLIAMCPSLPAGADRNDDRSTSGAELSRQSMANGCIATSAPATADAVSARRNESEVSHSHTPFIRTKQSSADSIHIVTSGDNIMMPLCTRSNWHPFSRPEHDWLCFARWVPPLSSAARADLSVAVRAGIGFVWPRSAACPNSL